MDTSILLKQLVSKVFSPEESVVANNSPSITMSSSIKRPAKLWELSETYHCPIIGTCLSISDLEKFARSFNFTASLRDEFALHVETVNRVSTRNEVSKAIHKFLNKKYQTYVIDFEVARNDADVLALWRKHSIHGEVAGALWAGFTHKAASNETRKIIYADMHMLSHQVGAGQATDMRRLARLEKENTEIKFALKQQQQQQARNEVRLRKQLHATESELENLRQSGNEVAVLRARIAALESGVAMVEMGQRLMSLTMTNEQLQMTSERVSTLTRLLETANNKAAMLLRERNMLVSEKKTLEQFLLTENTPDESKRKSLLPHMHSMRNSCILCVGGRITLLPQYRMLAEQLGIRLIHHDGGQQEALSRLHSMVDSADAVICPTDCVSHAAYYQLKRHCRRTGKRCLLFKGASVSGFTTALATLSSDPTNISRNAIKRVPEIIEK